MMRSRAILAVVGLLVAAAACRPKPVLVVPAPSTPTFPDFVRPGVPPSFANSAAAISEEHGWAFLQSGDLRNAEREFATALKAAPAFYPAEASLGYVELARKDPKAALSRFDRALETRQTDVGTLIGADGLTRIVVEDEEDVEIEVED